MGFNKLGPEGFEHLKTPELVVLSDRDVVAFIPESVPFDHTEGMELFRKDTDEDPVYESDPKIICLESERLLLWGRVSQTELVAGFRWTPYQPDDTTNLIKPLREVLSPRVTYDKTSNTISLWFWTNVKLTHTGTTYSEDDLVPLGFDGEPEDYAKRVLCYAVGSFKHLYVKGGIIGDIVEVEGEDQLVGYDGQPSTTDQYDVVPVFSRPVIVTSFATTGGFNPGIAVDGVNKVQKMSFCPRLVWHPPRNDEETGVWKIHVRKGWRQAVRDSTGTANTDTQGRFEFLQPADGDELLSADEWIFPVDDPDPEVQQTAVADGYRVFMAFEYAGMEWEQLKKPEYGLIPERRDPPNNIPRTGYREFVFGEISIEADKPPKLTVREPGHCVLRIGEFIALPQPIGVADPGSGYNLSLQNHSHPYLDDEGNKPAGADCYAESSDCESFTHIMVGVQSQIQDDCPDGSATWDVYFVPKDCCCGVTCESWAWIVLCTYAEGDDDCSESVVTASGFCACVRNGRAIGVYNGLPYNIEATPGEVSGCVEYGGQYYRYGVSYLCDDSTCETGCGDPQLDDNTCLPEEPL